MMQLWRQRAARRLGQSAEDQACAELLERGMQLIERNYRVRGGEIDLILRAPDGTLVFVEVRARSHDGFGGAAGSIGARKRARIILAARHYLARLPEEPACRFDVVTLDAGRLQWLPGAFAAEG
ncbi:MAG: YraN family protein [Thiomonas sp.]